MAGDDLAAIRHDLPEEFWFDFDRMVSLLDASVDTTARELIALADSVSHLSDKSVGLALKSMPPAISPYLFAYRSKGWNDQRLSSSKNPEDVEANG